MKPTKMWIDDKEVSLHQLKIQRNNWKVMIAKKSVDIGLWTRLNPATWELTDNYKDMVIIPLNDTIVSELYLSKEIFEQIKDYIKNNSI